MNDGIVTTWSAQQQAHVDATTLGAILANSTMIALAVIRWGRFVFANPAFHALFKSTESLHGVPLSHIVIDTDCDRLVNTLVAAEHAPTRYFGTGQRGEDASFDLELCLEPAVVNGEAATIAFAWDVTEMQRSREQLVYLAYTDSLTGLANRALFADHLHQAVRFARRHRAVLAVLMVDLDGFKAVNDTYGHDAGDTVLRLVGQRFQGCVREGDTLGRIGGDEFAVLLPRLADQQAAALVAQRLIHALDAPLDLVAHTVPIGASIGIAVWPEHAETVDGLLAAADTAMYGAKRTGKNRFQWAVGRSSADIISLQPRIWISSHAVGIEQIDEQHLHLAELIDRLSTGLRDAQDAGRTTTGLDELVRYAAFHFGTEERLMEQFRIPDLADHREEHRRLLHDIRKLQMGDDIGSVSLILRFLQEWLLRHVDGMDKRLGQALVACGCR